MAQTARSRLPWSHSICLAESVPLVLTVRPIHVCAVVASGALPWTASTFLLMDLIADGEADSACVMTTAEARLSDWTGSLSQPPGRSRSWKGSRVASIRTMSTCRAIRRCWNPSSMMMQSMRAPRWRVSNSEIARSRIGSAATGTAGLLRRCSASSSEMPLILLPYPRRTMPGRYPAILSAWTTRLISGVLPVPPTEMLPMEMTGMTDLWTPIFLSNFAFLRATTMP